MRSTLSSWELNGHRVSSEQPGEESTWKQTLR
jgi:hypothetical protein